MKRLFILVFCALVINCHADDTWFSIVNDWSSTDDTWITDSGATYSLPHTNDLVFVYDMQLTNGTPIYTDTWTNNWDGDAMPSVAAGPTAGVDIGNRLVDGTPELVTSFDGSDDIIIATNLSWIVTNVYTLSGWFNPDDTDGTILYYSFGLGLNTADSIALRLGGTYNAAGLPANSVGIVGSGGASTVAGTWTDALRAGGWHHVLATYDSAADPKQRIWINGVTQTMDSAGIAANVAQFNRMSVGVRNSGSFKYVGDIDDVIVWKKVLTDTEITNLYWQTLHPTNSNLIYLDR